MVKLRFHAVSVDKNGMTDNLSDSEKLNLFLQSLEARIFSIEQVLIGVAMAVELHRDYQKELDLIKNRVVIRNVATD